MTPGKGLEGEFPGGPFRTCRENYGPGALNPLIQRNINVFFSLALPGFLPRRCTPHILTFARCGVLLRLHFTLTAHNNCYMSFRRAHKWCAGARAFSKYTMCTRSNVTCGQSHDKILNEIFFKKLYFISFSLFLSPFNKELNTKRLQIPFFAMFFELSLEINVRYFVFSHIRRVTKTICHILKTIYQKGCPPLH